MHGLYHHTAWDISSRMIKILQSNSNWILQSEMPVSIVTSIAGLVHNMSELTIQFHYVWICLYHIYTT